MPSLFHDVETRSPVNLKKSGQYVYAENPYTEIAMMSWAVDTAAIRTWYPAFGEPCPRELEDAFEDPGVSLVAHNASFERVMLSITGWRRKIMRETALAALRPIRRWNCTAARAASMGLPRTLDGAASALQLPFQKDKEGHKLMLKLCVPKGYTPEGAPLFVNNETLLRREGKYCELDVETERAADSALPDLSPVERRVWELTETMNDRGVRIDTALLGRLIFFVVEAEMDVNARLSEATNGVVKRVSDHAKLRSWLVTQGVESVEQSGVGKQAIAELLASPEIPALIREVLIMRQEGGKSSASKYRAILNRLNTDGRLRGAMVFAGAAATARWSSRGAQLQNLPRGGTVKNMNAAIDDLMAGITFGLMRDRYGPPLVLASEMLRPIFMA